VKEDQIIGKLLEYQASGFKIFISSSFQTHSIPLLHIMSNSGVSFDVVFINTGFHFPETIEYRDQIAGLLQLKVIDAHSPTPKHLQKDAKGQFYFMSDPDYCCYLNKTKTLEPFLMEYDIWVNGIRADQNPNRAKMSVEASTPQRATRFHPILDWTTREIYEYRKAHHLPAHPLEKQGFFSIGCKPCTRNAYSADERSGRWQGMNKTECGLHTDLINK
jgi:phosphoadenosine phosphosulfate reductase